MNVVLRALQGCLTDVSVLHLLGIAPRADEEPGSCNEQH